MFTQKQTHTSEYSAHTIGFDRHAHTQTHTNTTKPKHPRANTKPHSHRYTTKKTNAKEIKNKENNENKTESRNLIYEKITTKRPRQNVDQQDMATQTIVFVTNHPKSQARLDGRGPAMANVF